MSLLLSNLSLAVDPDDVADPDLWILSVVHRLNLQVVPHLELVLRLHCFCWGQAGRSVLVLLVVEPQNLWQVFGPNLDLHCDPLVELRFDRSGDPLSHRGMCPGHDVFDAPLGEELPHLVGQHRGVWIRQHHLGYAHDLHGFLERLGPQGSGLPLDGLDVRSLGEGIDADDCVWRNLWVFLSLVFHPWEVARFLLLLLLEIVVEQIYLEHVSRTLSHEGVLTSKVLLSGYVLGEPLVDVCTIDASLFVLFSSRLKDPRLGSEL